MIIRSIWKHMLVFLLLALFFSWNTRPVNAVINNNGSGFCWQSGAAWPSNSVSYKIDPTIPASWTTNINTSATTWTNIGSSSFTLSNNSSSANVISKGSLANPSHIALASIYASPTTINKVLVVFDQTDSFTTILPASPESHWVTEIMTHEFGHWFNLRDNYSSMCRSVTMYGTFESGESYRASLTSYDINGAAWQYP